VGNGLNESQIQRAKEVDILEYLMCRESENLVKSGSSYHLKDHDSLSISNGKWYWHSQGFGDINALNFLIKVRGYTFVDAVEQLVGTDFSVNRDIVPKSQPPPRKQIIKKIKLPIHNRNNNRVIAYLQSRGIDKKLLLDCINSGVIYESVIHHNCVFIGKDERGKTRFAAMRGTLDSFKCDSGGSDKRYGFTLHSNSNKCDTVAVFESPIDVLSYTTLYPNCECHRLSLGGTALAALNHFLENNMTIEKIIVCTDNDEAVICALKTSKKLTAIALSGSCRSSEKTLTKRFSKCKKESVNNICKLKGDLNYEEKDKGLA